MSANFRLYYLKPYPITKFGIIADVLLLIAHVLPLTAHVLPLIAHCSRLIAHVLASVCWSPHCIHKYKYICLYDNYL
jgi:hypothetical protein